MLFLFNHFDKNLIKPNDKILLKSRQLGFNQTCLRIYNYNSDLTRQRRASQQSFLGLAQPCHHLRPKCSSGPTATKGTGCFAVPLPAGIDKRLRTVMPVAIYVEPVMRHSEQLELAQCLVNVRFKIKCRCTHTACFVQRLSLIHAHINTFFYKRF